MLNVVYCDSNLNLCIFIAFGVVRREYNGVLRYITVRKLRFGFAVFPREAAAYRLAVILCRAACKRTFRKAFTYGYSRCRRSRYSRLSLFYYENTLFVGDVIVYSNVISFSI